MLWNWSDQKKKNMEFGNRKKSKLIISPTGLLIFLLVMIFLIELSIMLVLNFYRLSRQEILVTILDSIILTVIFYPIIYFLVYRPFLMLLREVKEKEAKTEILATDLEKFKMAVDYTFDHIVITDPDGIALHVNHGVEHMTGFSRNEIIGKKVGTKELWGGLMGQAFYKKFWKTIKYDKKVFVGEINNRRKNGEEYAAQISVSPVLSKDQRVLYFVGIERDITEEKRIDKAKTEIISLASHQLLTPLTAIKWYVEMLTSGDVGKLTDNQQKYAEEINRGNQRMIDLVKSLLNVSRIELGTLTIVPKETQIIDIAKSLINEFISQIDSKKQKIIEKYEKLPKILIDPKLMRMIIQNILSNAIKYTPEKGTITIKIENKSQNALITISDTGYGIPSKQQSQIFQKLFRADNARQKDTEGTGLGLYIVKAIVEQSGGKIWFDSMENKGSTFYVTMPLIGMVKKEGTKFLENIK